MSAVLAIAQPRRIEASHRRRRKVTAGHFVQRYYDPQIGRFLRVDPVVVDTDTAGNFCRYCYAAENPYLFTDPDGRATRSPNSRDAAALEAKRSSRQETVEKVAEKVGSNSQFQAAFETARDNGIAYKPNQVASDAGGGYVSIGTHAFETPDLIEATVVHEFVHVEQQMNGQDASSPENEQKAHAAELTYIGEHNLQVPTADLDYIRIQAGVAAPKEKQP